MLSQSNSNVSGSFDPAGSVAWTTRFPPVSSVPTLPSGIGATWKAAVIVGATLVTLTVAVSVSHAPAASQTCTPTMWVLRPSTPGKEAVTLEASSYWPSLSRSQL